MKAKILSKLLKGMDGKELYAFLTATVLSMCDESGATPEEILNNVLHIIKKVRVKDAR